MENKASTRPNDCKQLLQEVIGRNFVEDLAALGNVKARFHCARLQNLCIRFSNLFA
jgi:hypothetical protein